MLEGGGVTSREHNSATTSGWMAHRGIRSLFPAIHNLFQSAVLNPKALHPGAYNPSILRVGDKTLISYRYHPANTPHTRLAIAEVDDKFHVLRRREVDANGVSVEDARLFTVDGEPWISYGVSQGPDGAWKCVVRYGRLVEAGDKWAVEGQHLLPHGSNDGTALEKNWVFFEEDGGIACFYSPGEVLRVSGNKVTMTEITEAPRWAWGPIRGGTVPFRYGDHLLRFFHSRLDNEPRPTYWRYFVGAMLLEPQWPYRVVRVSRSPIIRGSELDAYPDEERREIFHHKPNVVFPCGAIEHQKGWLLACGVNDCSCVMVKFEEKDLKL